MISSRQPPPQFEDKLEVIGKFKNEQSSQMTLAAVRDIFQIRLRPTDEVPVTCALIRLDNSKYTLYEFVSTLDQQLSFGNDQLEGLKEVTQFRQISIPEKSSIRLVPLLDNILMMVFDEGALHFYNCWSNDWSEPILEMPLSFQLTNIRMFKVTSSQFIIASVTYRLYQLSWQPKNKGLKIKLQHELLAWEFQTHHKFLLIEHYLRRTELILANQSKEFGIAQIKCLWKAKKVNIIANYLPNVRVFDIALVQRPTLDSLNNQELVKFLLVYHNETKGPLKFTLINLSQKTVHQVFEFKELQRLLPLNMQNGYPMPFHLVMEHFLGPRLVNLENEQIVQRLRLQKEDIGASVNFVEGSQNHNDGVKIMLAQAGELKFYTLPYVYQY